MSCSMSIEQKLCEVKIFPLQSMSNAIRSIDQRFVFKNSRISCLSRLALIFNLNNRRTTILYAKNRLQVAKYDESYTVFFREWIRTYGLVLKVSSMESGDMGPISDECWNSVLPHGHFAWHWARQCTYLYCCTLYNFSFLDFVSGGLALTEL